MWLGLCQRIEFVRLLQCHVRNKDIRKFLDGCYVSEKGFVDKTSGREDDKTKK